jgi:hypothetical protein
MTKIVDRLPVKTRLPITAWFIAGLVTFFSMASSLLQFIDSGGADAMAEQVHHASVTDLLGLLRAL